MPPQTTTGLYEELKRLGKTDREIIQVAQRVFDKRKTKRAGEVAAWNPYPWQVPPAEWKRPDGKRTFIWGLAGGRGTGKTEGCARYVLDHMRSNPGARVTAIAATRDDARAFMLEGPTGLLAVAKHGEFSYNRTSLEGWHVNGAQIRFYGSERPDRLRGPQSTLIWGDEVRAWKYPSKDNNAWDNAVFGLRMGSNPVAVLGTTPTRRPWVRDIFLTQAVLTTGRTRDATGLHQDVRDRFLDRYGGTRLERIELDGTWDSVVEGALWNPETIERTRVQRADMPQMWRAVVAIDPSASHTDEACETGLAGVGCGLDGDAYVIESAGVRLSPIGWGIEAVRMAIRIGADKIVGERNNGGDMVVNVVTQAIAKLKELGELQPGDPEPIVTTVWASRGKATRAEPAATTFERGHGHIVGSQPELEDQLCTAKPSETGQLDPSEDWGRLDAMVWAMHDVTDSGSDLKIIYSRAAGEANR